MPYDSEHDDISLVEAARKHLATAELGDEAAAILTQLIDHYDTLLAENRRLVRISDQIRGDLKLEANTDKQTGVFNRAHFIEVVERELERAVRFDRPLSLLLIRIDGFGEMNDRFGQRAQTAILQTLAAASLGVLRRIDSFGRASDDGFAALLPETDTTGAVILAERLRDAVANMGIAVGDDSIEFTVSVGVISRSGEDDKAEAMLQKAGNAVDTSHGDRGNRVAVAT